MFKKCQDCEFEAEKTTIIMNIQTCKECPKCVSARNPNTGFALDYYCTHLDILKRRGCGDDHSKPGKIVMSCVEYSSDENPVPGWCPMIHENCEGKIKWLEEQLTQRIETSKFAVDQLQEKEILCQTVKNFEDYLNELRFQYTKLYTYWKLQDLSTEYKLAKYNFDDLKKANKLFVELLKLDSYTESKYCDECRKCFGKE